ncbi:MAG TPA: hypothetical protein DHW22_09130 [Planctomycetaceae bacterium]|nr:hypothetical protein [Planctomycetaceae bacterium]
MAIAILIADSSEADSFLSLGCELAIKLDKPLAILCIAKSDEKPTSSPDSTSTEDATRFFSRNNYADSVRQSLQAIRSDGKYQGIAAEIFEVPSHVESIRDWLTAPPATAALGRFEIETLFLPMRRDDGVQQQESTKHRLFGIAHCETVLAVVNPDANAGKMLGDFACLGATSRDVRKSRQFIRRFRNTKSIVSDWQTSEVGIDCAVLTIRGKAGQARLDSKLWSALKRDQSLAIAMGVNPADSFSERCWLRIDNKLLATFLDYQMDRRDRERLASELQGGTKASPEFLLFMSVATILASIGLLQDSPAVIIGAMLVAPLMTPLLGAGLAMIQGNRPLFLTACRAILVGVCLSFMIGASMGIVAAILPAELFAGSGLRLTNAMIARSHPNLLDPIVGFAAGLAGGFSVGRDKKIGALAGVAIAAALVPPIATAGIEAALIGVFIVTVPGEAGILPLISGDPTLFLELVNLIDPEHKTTESVRLVAAPLALFLMNACTVILGAWVGLRLVGMHRTMYPKESQRWVSIAALTILLSLLALLMIVPFMTWIPR